MSLLFKKISVERFSKALYFTMFSIWLKLEKRLSDQQLKIQNRGFEYVYLVTVVLRRQSGSPVIVTQSLQKVREKLRLKIRSIPAELQG